MAAHPAQGRASAAHDSSAPGERFGRRLARRWRELVFQPRGPEKDPVFLNQRRVFILPTAPGLLFAIMLVALLLGSINYALSLGFALTFLMASVAWVGMFYTFRNLAHLWLSPGRVEPIFAGDLAEFGIILSSRSRFDRFAIDLTADATLAPVSTDVAAHAQTSIQVPVRIATRGWHAMPRIVFETRFPLGLWRAWSYWQPDLKVLAYPLPGPAGEPFPTGGAGGEPGLGHVGRGSEDYAGIRAYAVGDSPRHLAWKAMARDPEEALLTKLFDSTHMETLWLDLGLLPAHLDLEAALSRLTRWVLEADALQLRYGLRLGTAVFEPSDGAAHRARCLEALAVYGHAEENA